MTLTLKLVEGHHIKVQILTKYLKCEVIYQPMSWKYTQELFRSKDIAQRCSKALQNMFKKVIKTTIFNLKMVKKNGCQLWQNCRFLNVNILQKL